MRYLHSFVAIALFWAMTASVHGKEYGTIDRWGNLIDPDADCAFLIADDEVTIRVPDSAHDLSAELRRMNAPRILREVRGDFVIDVTIDGDFSPANATIAGRTAYNGAGLVLWQDERNYIRLERAALKRSGQTRHYVNFEHRSNGRIVRIGTPADFQVDPKQPLQLRLDRQPEQVLGWVKQGDDDWQALNHKKVQFSDQVQVGVAAINASNAEFSPRFQDLNFQSNSVAVAKSTPAKPQDPYTVPDGSVEDLVAFIKRVRAIRPRTRDDYVKHLSKSPRALSTAAEKILEADDAPPEAIDLAKGIGFQEELKSITRMGEQKRQELFEAIIDFCAESESYRDNVQLLTTLARGLEYSKQTEMAAEAYLAASDLMKRSGSPALEKQAEKMAGAARRVNLLGNPMSLHGKTMDGEEFDVAKYKGKVVLVDFWATWCGPCIAELPNVKTNYELYHEKGFEIVGVCLDTSRKKLEDFVEKQSIPWVNLFEDNAGWNHSVANQYGVMSIPTVILLDREGKAISLKARGRELGQLLEEHLGPVDPERRREIEEKMKSQSASQRTVRSAPSRPTQPTPLIVHQRSAVYLADADGSNFRRLIRNEDYEWHGSPSISPDGKRIAWNAHKRSLTSPSVFIGNMEGKVAHEVAGATRPLWLSDESLLAEKNRKIVKIVLDEQTDKEIREQEFLEGLYPSLSNNRQFLVFNRGAEIVVRNLDSGQEQSERPMPPARFFNGFAVSDDGEAIAYIGLKDRGEGVYLASMTDGKGTQIADASGAEHFPSYAPNGKKVMFTAGSIALDRDHHVSRIYVANLETNETTAITSEDYYCRDASWSPDGKTVAMVAVSKSDLQQRLNAGGLNRNNFKQFGLALHNHHSAFKQLPPMSSRIHPELSWRVQVLPFIEQQDLYRQFKLDEPWDSDHNRKLVDKMPDIFRMGLDTSSKPGKTRIVMPFHEEAVYRERGKGSRFRDILDGLSNTILMTVADEDAAVTWTKPDDLPIDMDHPKEGWFQGIDGEVLVLLGDGAVVALPSDTPDEVVRSMLTRAGKEIVKAPGR